MGLDFDAEFGLEQPRDHSRVWVALSFTALLLVCAFGSLTWINEYRGAYAAGYDAGKLDGIAECPECPTCFDNYTIGFGAGYAAGWQAGYAEGWAAGDQKACNLQLSFEENFTVRGVNSSLPTDDPSYVTNESESYDVIAVITSYSSLLSEAAEWIIENNGTLFNTTAEFIALLNSTEYRGVIPYGLTMLADFWSTPEILAALTGVLNFSGFGLGGLVEGIVSMNRENWTKNITMPSCHNAAMSVTVITLKNASDPFSGDAVTIERGLNTTGFAGVIEGINAQWEYLIRQRWNTLKIISADYDFDADLPIAIHLQVNGVNVTFDEEAADGFGFGGICDFYNLDEGWVTLPNHYNTLSSTLAHVNFTCCNNYALNQQGEGRFVNMTFNGSQNIDFGWQVAAVTATSVTEVQNLTVNMYLVVNQTINISVGWMGQNELPGFQWEQNFTVTPGGYWLSLPVIGDGGYGCWFENASEAVDANFFCDHNTMFQIRYQFPDGNYTVDLDSVLATFYATNLAGDLYRQFYYLDGYPLVWLAAPVLVLAWKKRRDL